jgi:hypothetical protein
MKEDELTSSYPQIALVIQSLPDEIVMKQASRNRRLVLEDSP